MNSRRLLAFSVALNFVALFFFLSARHSQKINPAISILSTAPEPAIPAKVSALPDQLPKPHNTPAVGWVQALRDAHISEKVIADVAWANFEDRWHQLALENQRKFNRGEIDQATLTGFDLKHDEEEEKEMRSVLGDKEYRHWDRARELADLDRAGVQLATDESDKLYDMRKDLDRKRLALDQARHDGKLTDEQAAAQSEALYAQYNQNLLTLLGDDRYAQIQNGGDTGIGELKQNLRDITTDDSQISGMETAQQAWDSQRSALDVKLQKGDITADDYQQQLKALDTQRDQEYQKVLGADGFAQFQRDQNEQYQTLKRVGSSLGFSGEDINNLYGMMQDYQNAARDYRDRAQQLQNSGQSVDWPAVDKVLANYSQQTENALRAQLGDNFEKLKRSNVMPFER